jgi:hypothetical protein
MHHGCVRSHQRRQEGSGGVVADIAKAPGLRGGRCITPGSGASMSTRNAHTMSPAATILRLGVPTGAYGIGTHDRRLLPLQFETASRFCSVPVGVSSYIEG